MTGCIGPAKVKKKKRRAHETEKGPVNLAKRVFMFPRGRCRKWSQDVICTRKENACCKSKIARYGKGSADKDPVAARARDVGKK